MANQSVAPGDKGHKGGYGQAHRNEGTCIVPCYRFPAQVPQVQHYSTRETASFCYNRMAAAGIRITVSDKRGSRTNRIAAPKEGGGSSGQPEVFDAKEQE